VPALDGANGVVLTIKDALTAIALVVAGAFSYFKFIKGRVLGPRVRLAVSVAVAPPPEDRPSLLGRRPPPVAMALRVDVAIRNDGQIVLRIPRESEQRLTVRSLTKDGLAAASLPGADMTPDGPLRAASWARDDIYFAQTNLIEDEGVPPPRDIKLEPGEDYRVGIVFGIPAGHTASAYLVVLNAYIVYRSWFRSKGDGWETLAVLVPDLASGTDGEAT
jgi:hypothetical protein